MTERQVADPRAEREQRRPDDQEAGPAGRDPEHHDEDAEIQQRRAEVLLQEQARRARRPTRAAVGPGPSRAAARTGRSRRPAARASPRGRTRGRSRSGPCRTPLAGTVSGAEPHPQPGAVDRRCRARERSAGAAGPARPGRSCTCRRRAAGRRGPRTSVSDEGARAPTTSHVTCSTARGAPVQSRKIIAKPRPGSRTPSGNRTGSAPRAHRRIDEPARRWSRATMTDPYTARFAGTLPRLAQPRDPYAPSAIDEGRRAAATVRSGGAGARRSRRRDRRRSSSRPSPSLDVPVRIWLDDARSRHRGARRVDALGQSPRSRQVAAASAAGIVGRHDDVARGRRPAIVSRDALEHRDASVRTRPRTTAGPGRHGRRVHRDAGISHDTRCPPIRRSPTRPARATRSRSRLRGRHVRAPLVGVAGVCASDVEHDDRDVVDAAGAVRRAHQPVRRVLRIGRGLQDRHDLILGDHAGEPVAAEQQAVAVDERRRRTRRRRRRVRCRGRASGRCGAGGPRPRPARSRRRGPCGSTSV